MRISEFIERLEAIREEHGDLEVEKYNGQGYRCPARVPETAYRRILKGRERAPVFAMDFDGPERRGEKVCRV